MLCSHEYFLDSWNWTTIRVTRSVYRPKQHHCLVQILTGEKVYDILKRISDDDCRLVGLDPNWSRPDWMLLTVMPVPPPHVRPAVDMDGMGRCEDDLTHKLADIIRANHALKQQMTQGAAEHVLKVCDFLCFVAKTLAY